MEGQEIAFWLMMGFSCLIGIFIGYLMFSPRRSRAGADDEFVHDSFNDETHADSLSSQIDPDTVPAREPWLTDKETLREQARERAIARMTEHSKRVRQETEAAKQAGRQSLSESEQSTNAEEPAQPYFDPDTIKEWDQVSPKSARRKPGTWVKATVD